jgi:hypothetical protein
VIRKPCSHWNVTLSMLVEWDDLEGFLPVYHDAVLRGGRMPVEMVRARLTHQERTRDHRAQWRLVEGRRPALARNADVPWLGIQPKIMNSMCALKPAKRPPRA